MLICVDLDGTLFDTVAVNAASYRAALAELGYTVTDEYYAKNCNGRYYKVFLPALMGGEPTPEAIERVHDRKMELYSSCLGAAKKNETLLTLLRTMRQNADCKTACVTTGSRRNATEILEHFGVLALFDLVVTSEDVVNNKPDPEGYLKAMAQFGMTPAETLIFEDSSTGISAAMASGAAVYIVGQF